MDQPAKRPPGLRPGEHMVLPLILLVGICAGASPQKDMLPPLPKNFVANDTSQYVCKVPADIPLDALKDIAERNCLKVNSAVTEFERLISTSHMFLWLGQHSAEQMENWKKVSVRALSLCELKNASSHANKTELAAMYAVNAWGTFIMNGRECCVLNTPPYCVDHVWSISTLALLGALSVLLLLFIGSVLVSFFMPFTYIKGSEDRCMETPSPPEDLAPAGYREPAGVSESLRKELEAAWLDKSCLRVLKGAKALAKASAHIFSELHERFDFQRDSVVCQHEHLLSLWRSMVAMVADRDIAEGYPVEEDQLLRKALDDLHSELLEGFRIWRRKMSEDPNSGMEEIDDEDDCNRTMPPLGGARIASQSGSVIFGDDADEACGDLARRVQLSVQLTEVITFLCVWGEAGNVRFMPEVLYFLTEMVLSAKDSGSCSALYNGAPRRSLEGPYRSGLFLSKVIRPIYNVVFDEWYERVEGQGKSKDKKVLREGFDLYLPPDVANYDDWDERFCNPAEVIEFMVLRDGTHLFDSELEHSDRFKALCHMDWPRSLRASKTHREVHSLWGVFASTHRIILLHLLLFFSGIILSADSPPIFRNKEIQIAGQTLAVRFAFVGLLAPVHGLLWSFARYETTGVAIRRVERELQGISLAVGRTLLLGTPLLTYILVRYYDWKDVHMLGHRSRYHENDDWSRYDRLVKVLAFHYIASGLAITYLLFWAVRSADRLFKMTYPPLRLRAIRNIFWFCVVLTKFILSTMVFREIFHMMKELDISMIGQETVSYVRISAASTAWSAHVMIWLMVWSMTFLLFISDTQLYFVLGCLILGTFSFLVQRRCKVVQFGLEDAVAKIPERFSKKVLTYSPPALEALQDSHWSDTYRRMATGDQAGMATFCAHFPSLWDRIVEYMRYEDKIDNQIRGDMSFDAGASGGVVTWDELQGPEGYGAALSSTQAASEKIGNLPVKRLVNLPEIFREKTACEAFFQDLNPGQFGPGNVEVQWRLKALSRGLGLPMPRPFRCPYIPGITVLVPHYGESILLTKSEVYNPKLNVPLIDWVEHKYSDEFRAFTTRMGWPAAGSHWVRYAESQWEKIEGWTSMRMQTLWRTIAGMFLYLPALQAHFEIQGDKTSCLAKNGVWNPADCFTLLISMQMYHFFDDTQLEHTNLMFKKFRRCLKVAFISMDDKNETAEVDNVHSEQQRRYYSCLIDETCKFKPDGKRMIPKLTIELPGFPILGDGKGDNQNHAIPFTRGMMQQCIDANQGAYFEQMMLLPCAMGEFRTRWKGDTHSKRIIGFPEHITSDIGTIGDLAAASELAFGTLLQRTYAVLGARMHYGHPDLMSKIWMLQQGGVSKATKTLNLSEDIFAGMDFTLRGEKRKIRHCEYFHLAKGRDLGFNAVLGFFSKLSSGAGEQILTRQMFRLHQLMGLPESLTFYYAHVGHYFTQFFVSMSMPVLTSVWLLLLVADCHSRFGAFESCGTTYGGESSKAAEVMARMLSVWFSTLVLVFITISIAPLFMEVWMQNRFIDACKRVAKQFLTASPLLFIFQAKTIGFYVMNELRYGGATYVATGRGLPTERRAFVGTPTESGCGIKKIGGLYLDYAHIAYYDGFYLLFHFLLVIHIGGVTQAGPGALWQLKYVMFLLLLTVTSWLFAPFLFNPYQFERSSYNEDIRAWFAFFGEGGGKHWVEWFNKNHLKPRKGIRHSIIDISFFFKCFWVTVWFTAVNMKLHVMASIYDRTPYLKLWFVMMLCPPVILSFLFCACLAPFEDLLGCARKRYHKGKEWLRLAVRGGSDDESDASGSYSGSDDDDEERGVGVDGRTAVDVTVKNSTHRISTETEEDDNSICCSCCLSCKNMPLSMLSVFVVVLDLVEIALTLYPLYWVRWTNAWCGAFVLKFTVMGAFLWLGEGVLKSKRAGELGCLLPPLQHWVYAHRMARDLIVSGFIFWTLGIFVVMNTLNEICLPGCSIHQLLIYRDPGHLQRSEAVVVDIDDSELDSSPEAGSAASPAQRRQKTRLTGGVGYSPIPMSAGQARNVHLQR